MLSGICLVKNNTRGIGIGLGYRYLRYRYCPLGIVQNIFQILYQNQYLNKNYLASLLRRGGTKEYDGAINCCLSSFPSDYIGLPFGDVKNNVALWKPVVEEFQRKLSIWKGKMISVGGRLTLVKLVLCNKPKYYPSLFRLPSTKK
ncbi:hypothetical protein GQ457_04G020950 [Hibiscus cannabinus]